MCLRRYAATVTENDYSLFALRSRIVAAWSRINTLSAASEGDRERIRRLEQRVTELESVNQGMKAILDRIIKRAKDDE